MGYNTKTFEEAAKSFGYVIERIKKNSLNSVDSMFGAIVEGTLVKQVRWDSSGHCFSYKGKRLPKYDLHLNAIHMHDKSKLKQ